MKKMIQVLHIVLGLTFALFFLTNCGVEDSENVYSAPTWIKAKTVSLSSISLSWESVTGASEYYVESTDGLENSNVSSTSTTMTGLQ